MISLTGPDLVNPMPLWQAALGVAAVFIVGVVCYVFFLSRES